MSFESTSRVLNECRLTGTAKLVLVGIASHDGDGGAWPSLDTLARYASIDRRSAQRAVGRLVDAGWLEVVPNGGGPRDNRGDRRPNLYRILWPATPPDGAAPQPPRGEPDGAALVTPRGGAGDAHGAALQPPERSIEKSKNRSARAAAPAAASLPGIEDVDPQPAPQPVDDPMRLPWRLVRLAWDERATRPVEGQKRTASVVRRLLDGGWSAQQVQEALLSAPAWSPGSLQVELARGNRVPEGRAVASTATEYEDAIWKPSQGGKR
jgi:hypothetical protein